MEWPFAPRVNIIPGISHKTIISQAFCGPRWEKNQVTTIIINHGIKLKGGPLQEGVIGKEPLVHATFVLHIWWEARPCLLNPQPTPGHHESPASNLFVYENKISQTREMLANKLRSLSVGRQTSTAWLTRTTSAALTWSPHYTLS